MNDKELVAVCVKLGVVHILAGKYWMPTGLNMEIGELPETVVCDWRVAGVLMEKAIEKGSFPFIGSCTTDTYQATIKRGWGANAAISHHVNESLPRAITEACVEVLS